MDVSAVTKYVRLSPLKCRDIGRSIQGMPAEQALDVLKFSTRKGAFYIGKTLRSAIANAEENEEASADALWVKDAIVEAGPTYARHWSGARGVWKPIRRRSTHIRITLTDDKASVSSKASRKGA